MGAPIRSLVVTAAALALTAPAYAANDQAPGQAKKQDTATVPVPAVPVVTQPAPAVPNPNGKAPVTKAPQGKATRPNATTTAPATTLPAAPVRKAKSRRPTATLPAAPTTRSRPRTGTSPRPSVRTRTPATRARQAQAIAAAAAASPITATHRSAPPTAHRHARRPKPRTNTEKKSTAPLTTISHAADRVVEVIPGAVILALAGLIALVMVLIARSWTMERRRGKALTRSYGITVEALATAIEAKDHCTGNHIERVRNLGLLLAREIVPREARDPQMAYGFLLHDIGKLAVPDAILRAPGRLNAEEWALMRRHPEEGVRMLSTVPFLDKALDVVHYHHERWDGGGYPAGLRGDEIPLWARIFSVVDALDAITAARPYRQGRSYQAALEEIRRHSGTQFDPAVVEALERIDPLEIEPLLEPTQVIDSPLAAVTDLRPLISA